MCIIQYKFHSEYDIITHIYLGNSYLSFFMNLSGVTPPSTTEKRKINFSLAKKARHIVINALFHLILLIYCEYT